MQPSKPDCVVETQSCLMCVEFHPHEPTLIAGGAFNGNIRSFILKLEGRLLIWNLNEQSQDEPLVSSSNFTEETHYEAITKVQS